MRLFITSLACVGAAACLVLIGSTLLYRVSMGAVDLQAWSTKAEVAQGSGSTTPAPKSTSTPNPIYFGEEYASQHRALGALPGEPAAPTF